MIWTLRLVTLFMTIMPGILTQSLKGFKQESELRNPIDHISSQLFTEELSKPLKYSDSDYMLNKQVIGESSFPPKGPNTQPNTNEELQKTVEQVLFTHHIDQNFTLNHGYNQTKSSDMKEFPRINAYKPFEYYKNSDTKKLPDIKNEGPRLLTRIQSSGLFKSIGTNPECNPIISAGIKSLPHHNEQKKYPFSFLDFITNKKEQPALSNSSRIHSNKDMITTRGVFPEEQFPQDALASVQKEGFNGFPKGKNQQFIFKMNIETESRNDDYNLETKTAQTSTTEEAFVPNDENNFAPEKYAVSSTLFKEIPVMTDEDSVKTNSKTEINSDINILTQYEGNNNTDPELQSTTEEQYALYVENTVATERSTDLAKSNKLNELKRIMDQKEEDDLRIQNAKYTFSISQKDGISDLLHDRTETRQDGKVTGSYAYSDGFFLRKVNYAADKNGYRIISEDAVPLPGNGPKVNPEGIAHIKTDVGGHSLHYVVYGEKLPQMASRRQNKGKI